MWPGRLIDKWTRRPSPPPVRSLRLTDRSARRSLPTRAGLGGDARRGAVVPDTDRVTKRSASATGAVSVQSAATDSQRADNFTDGQQPLFRRCILLV